MAGDDMEHEKDSGHLVPNMTSPPPDDDNGESPNHGNNDALDLSGAADSHGPSDSAASSDEQDIKAVPDILVEGPQSSDSQDSSGDDVGDASSVSSFHVDDSSNDHRAKARVNSIGWGFVETMGNLSPGASNPASSYAGSTYEASEDGGGEGDSTRLGIPSSRNRKDTFISPPQSVSGAQVTRQYRPVDLVLAPSQADLQSEGSTPRARRPGRYAQSPRTPIDIKPRDSTDDSPGTPQSAPAETSALGSQESVDRSQREALRNSISEGAKLISEPSAFSLANLLGFSSLRELVSSYSIKLRYIKRLEVSMKEMRISHDDEMAKLKINLQHEKDELLRMNEASEAKIANLHKQVREMEQATGKVEVEQRILEENRKKEEGQREKKSEKGPDEETEGANTKEGDEKTNEQGEKEEDSSIDDERPHPARTVEQQLEVAKAYNKDLSQMLAAQRAKHKAASDREVGYLAKIDEQARDLLEARRLRAISEKEAIKNSKQYVELKERMDSLRFTRKQVPQPLSGVNSVGANPTHKGQDHFGTLRRVTDSSSSSPPSDLSDGDDGPASSSFGRGYQPQAPNEDLLRPGIDDDDGPGQRTPTGQQRQNVRGQNRVTVDAGYLQALTQELADFEARENICPGGIPTHKILSELAKMMQMTTEKEDEDMAEIVTPDSHSKPYIRTRVYNPERDDGMEELSAEADMQKMRWQKRRAQQEKLPQSPAGTSKQKPDMNQDNGPLEPIDQLPDAKAAATESSHTSDNALEFSGSAATSPAAATVIFDDSPDSFHFLPNDSRLPTRSPSQPQDFDLATSTNDKMTSASKLIHDHVDLQKIEDLISDFTDRDEAEDSLVEPGPKQKLEELSHSLTNLSEEPNLAAAFAESIKELVEALQQNNTNHGETLDKIREELKNIIAKDHQHDLPTMLQKDQTSLADLDDEIGAHAATELDIQAYMAGTRCSPAAQTSGQNFGGYSMTQLISQNKQQSDKLAEMEKQQITAEEKCKADKKALRDEKEKLQKQLNEALERAEKVSAERDDLVNDLQALQNPRRSIDESPESAQSPDDNQIPEGDPSSDVGGEGENAQEPQDDVGDPEKELQSTQDALKEAELRVTQAEHNYEAMRERADIMSKIIEQHNNDRQKDAVEKAVQASEHVSADEHSELKMELALAKKELEHFQHELARRADYKQFLESGLDPFLASAEEIAHGMEEVLADLNSGVSEKLDNDDDGNLKSGDGKIIQEQVAELRQKLQKGIELARAYGDQAKQASDERKDENGAIKLMQEVNRNSDNRITALKEETEKFEELLANANRQIDELKREVAEAAVQSSEPLHRLEDDTQPEADAEAEAEAELFDQVQPTKPFHNQPLWQRILLWLLEGKPVSRVFFLGLFWTWVFAMIAVFLSSRERQIASQMAGLWMDANGMTQAYMQEIQAQGPPTWFWRKWLDASIGNYKGELSHTF